MTEKIERRDCEYCDGSGYVKQKFTYFGVPGIVENIEDCGTCEGTGKVNVKVVDNRKGSLKNK